VGIPFAFLIGPEAIWDNFKWGKGEENAGGKGNHPNKKKKVGRADC